jgi:hypothetical protein
MQEKGDQQLMKNEEVDQQPLPEVDIEEFAKTANGKGAPKARQYRIRIDKEKKTVLTSTTTGREILSLVGKTPDTDKLYQHKRAHQPIVIAPDDVVDLRAPGVERFTTMPKDTTEGREDAAPAREFSLPEADESYLNGLGLDWHTLKEGETQWLVMHGWKLPPGYNRTEASLALLIPPSYSDGQIDMVYFSPGLARIDGKTINALSPQVIRSEGFQRWSRHRTAVNPWRVGVDDIASHLTLVDDWLRREFEAGRA